MAATTTAATAGGNTTFGASLTAKGGIAGGSTTVAAAEYRWGESGVQPSPSTNTGATLNLIGGVGQRGYSTTPAAGAGMFQWAGGVSALGGATKDNGVISASGATAGVAATDPGAGGGGATAWRAGADVEANGGAGFAGVIIIEEFY